ncbi:MAG: septal ring lytic transglycosylase RlpA family protein [Candidatus Bipolaricaulota bacterium]|nr:septal ring lytic transglycosylase RlpA family protein [Candidatus Bipolaricaulota bacterium]MBS3791453.1 septal ring lytic transglycosylase RlpA family protein [Candidatus Bipolaricaulota bacterium]
MPKLYLLLGVSLIAAGIIIGLTSSPGGGYYQTGTASWYGPNFQGNPTANGEVFDMNELTAAHKSLPFNTRVKVVDLSSGNEVVVRINDRGPFIKGRIIDLSRRAAEKLGIIDSGTAKVGLKIVKWGD